MADAAAYTYRLCDDGIPAHGGRDPNPGADRAIAVPAAYAGEDGLPPADRARAATVPGNSEGTVALDVNVALPDPVKHAAPYPLIALMHGCCGGSRTDWQSDRFDANREKWHYNSAWWAARGYVVLTWTGRGFVDGQGQGSTGEMHINSQQFEVNDFQHLAGQLADDPFFAIDPERVVVTGGSLGGGFAWQAFTDPLWKSPGGKPMRLVAVAPKYGWTDILETLVPTGRHVYDEGPLPAFDGSDSGYTPGQKLGMPIRSIIQGLFLSGDAGLPSAPPNNSHTTFPDGVRQAYFCTAGPWPLETSPLCGAALADFVPNSLRFRSAYYRNGFFEKLRNDPAYRVPVFSAGAWTDPLFPPMEHRRMAERLRATVPGYPIQEYHGDYQHFVQNKAKEWGDQCGEDRHVCTTADHPGADVERAPATRRRVGITTMLNRFIDHYARPGANRDEPAPASDISASLQICPRTATDAWPADGPGETFTADSYDGLTPGKLTLRFDGGAQTVTSDAEPNHHSVVADPVFNTASNGSRCATHRDEPGPGVAVHQSAPLERDATLIGGTMVEVEYAASGDTDALQLNARLYDVLPDGTMVLADRGPRRIDPARDGSSKVRFQLHGNGWRFAKGHRIRVELAMDDEPYLHQATSLAAMTLGKVTLEMPVRETEWGLDDTPPPRRSDVVAPKVALNVRRSSRRSMLVRVRCSEACSGTLEARVGKRRVGRVAVRLTRPGSTTVRMRLRGVRARQRITLQLSVRDAARNRRVFSRRARV